MATLYIKKINETYIELASDEQYILQELSDYYSFYADGFKFSPAFRNHVWDGKIRLVNLWNQTTLVGLIPSIIKFCADRNYEFVDQTPDYLEQQSDSLEHYDEFIKSLNLEFEPRDYQHQLIQYAIKSQRALMLSSTGCHTKGTKVVMSDGSTKCVEEVEVGDQLLGCDNQPREVLKLYHNKGKMYRIKPIRSQSFVVNEDHILPLWDEEAEQIQCVPVFELIKKPKEFFNTHYLINRNNPHHEMFEIEYVGVDQYYGFELDKDHLYYTDNWILNHNSGKSLVIYCLTRWMLNRDRKVVIIVPSTSLVEQMHNDFKNYAKKDKAFDVDQNVHKLYSKIKTTDPYNDQCIITTWQSIKNYDKALFELWDTVIIDEAHGVHSKELTKIVSQAINARFRYGLTGTLTGMACHEFQITGLLGSVFQATTTKDLQNKGYLSDCKIYMLDLKYPTNECKDLWKQTKELKKTYFDEVDFVNNHPKRQLFLRNLICALKGITLVLFRFRDHGQHLYQLIKEKVGDSREVFYIDGTIDPQTRERIRQQLKDPNSDAILVFSVATSSTGIDIKGIQNLIINPSKSKVQTLQSIGRSLRLCDGKKGAKIFDLVDDLRTGRRRNFLYNLAEKRIEIYNEQGFDIEYKTVQF